MDNTLQEKIEILNNHYLDSTTQRLKRDSTKSREMHALLVEVYNTLFIKVKLKKVCCASKYIKYIKDINRKWQENQKLNQ